MDFTLTGILAKVTIKPPKEEGNAPTAIIQIETDVTHELGKLNLFVGRDVDATIKPLQTHLDELGVPRADTLAAKLARI